LIEVKAQRPASPARRRPWREGASKRGFAAGENLAAAFMLRMRNPKR
jgi:hypothetical protein